MNIKINISKWVYKKMAIDEQMNDVERFAKYTIAHLPAEQQIENLSDYEQVHVAVAYSGDPKDYLDRARIELAKKAIAKGCERAVDADYCQDKPDRGSVILAATGLRKKKASKLERTLTPEIFAEEDISHVSRREFLQRKNDSPDKYKSVELTVAYQGKEGENYLEAAELKLAKEAIKEGCRYVTEMDYISHDPEHRTVSMAVTGLIRKTEDAEE